MRRLSCGARSGPSGGCGGRSRSSHWDHPPDRRSESLKRPRESVPSHRRCVLDAFTVPRALVRTRPGDGRAVGRRAPTPWPTRPGSPSVGMSLGYHRFWVAEHHNMPGVASTTPPVLIAHLAASTERIKVGSGGVMLPNHPPLVVAEQFAHARVAPPRPHRPGHRAGARHGPRDRRRTPPLG